MEMIERWDDTSVNFFPGKVSTLSKAQHAARDPPPSLKQGRIEAAKAAKEAERLRREEERLQVQAEGRAARKAAAGARGRGAPPRASRSSSARSAQPARGPKSNLPTHGAHAIPCLLLCVLWSACMKH